MDNIDYSKFHSSVVNNNTKTIKGKITKVNSTNTKALVEFFDNDIQLNLNNKTGEKLAVGDYVSVQYSGHLSSNTAYISFRNGAPRFNGQFEIMTQSKYDTLENNGEIIDGILYVIVGD